MNTRYMLIGLIAAMLLSFGCFHEQPPPTNGTPDGDSGGNGSTIGGGINISGGGTQNQTVGGNDTGGGDNGGNGSNGNGPTGPQYTSTPDAVFGIYFIYVGAGSSQGDSILIKKGDFDMLIDAGSDANGGIVVDFLTSRGVDDIEVLVSTNADSDHYGGISKVLDEFTVEEFWWSGEDGESAEYQALLSRIDALEVGKKQVKRLEAYSFNGMNFTILNPKTDKYDDIKADSVAIRLDDRDFCALFTSDITIAPMRDLKTNYKSQINCGVVQLPNHALSGFIANDINLFVLETDASIAVTSGALGSQDEQNSRAKIERLINSRGIQYYYNYNETTVRIVSDGYTYNTDYLN